jgi:ABC-type multidrug transport system ATPase subunit
MSSVIELRDVHHSFGTVEVLNGVTMSVAEGEARALVGEHGAGKSTLAQILGGFITPTAGSVEFRRERRRPTLGPFSGVELVHQTTELMENLTVSENMFIAGSRRSRSLFHRQKELHAFANEYFTSLGIDLRGEQLVAGLKRADWVLIDILRRLYRSPRLLILDEAIEQLSSDNAEIVLEILKKEKRRGLAIVYITHRVDDVYTFADTVSIIKNGTVCLTEATENIDKINLIKIAYTQVADSGNLEQYNEEFLHLLKYNEAILRKLPVSLIVTGRDESIKIVNEAARSLLMIDESHTDATLDSVFRKSSEIAELIRSSFRTDETRQFYYVPFTRADSQELLLDISKVPIFDEHFLIGNILLFNDITQQEHLRQEFELRDKLAATGLLAAGVAHEINNPIGMILNDLHFLKVTGSDVRVQQRVSNLEKHFGYITSVVSNLLTFSEQRPVASTETVVNGTIRELLHLLQFYVETKRVRITFDTTETGEPFVISMPAHKLKQVLLNLIKNSLEAFSGPGTIGIRTRLASTPDGRYCTIVVEDDGPGFDPASLSSAFLPFHSAKNDTGANLGLGLAVTHSIVRSHGGLIEIRNGSDGGCVVSISFPLVTQLQ